MAEALANSIQSNPLPYLLGGSLAVTGAYYLHGKIQDCKERRFLTEKRTRRQQERNEQFRELAKKYPILQENLWIVQLPFEELQSKLQGRELTAKTVLQAYVAKALAVTTETNCITEFIPHMWRLAEELDKLPQVKGPLHGIPICVKDDHAVVDMDSTIGLSINLEKPASRDATVVQILEDLGAVPFCKTNVPQTIFSPSSDNPIYGTTVNHLNKKLSPGGSSSGTGCLVGAGGAAFGLGSDLGGSVRIPAHMNGVATLRPTIGRISGKGVTQCIEGSAGFVGVSGILAQRAQTVASVFENLTTDSLQNKYDPLALPIPWNNKVFESKENLRIGYFTSLPFFPSLGDTPMTIINAKRALEKMGHTVVPFEMPDNWHLIEVFATLACADGGNQIYNKLKHDQVSHVAAKFMGGRTLLSSISMYLNSLVSKKSIRDFVGNPDGQRSEVLWDYLVKQTQIKYDIFDRMREQQLDLLLTPAYPFPASKIEDTDALLGAVVYTCPWNLCDCPAGIVPFGKESCTRIDGYDDQGDVYLKMAKDGIKLAKDMPIGVQIIGKPYNEELVLRVLTELDKYKLTHDE